MSTLKAHNIEPATGTDVALGAAGDSITISGDSLKLNTFKDAGANTLFTSDGSGTLSNVNSALSPAGPVLILSQTATAATSVEFTSGIDSTYDKYMFVFIDINPIGDGTILEFQVNASGESGFNEVITSSMFKAYHYESDQSDLVYETDHDQAQGTAYQRLTTSIGSDADESCAGELFLFSPSSTAFVKNFYARINQYASAVYCGDVFTAGYINTTLAITQISFKMRDGQGFDGKIKMYGIK